MKILFVPVSSPRGIGEYTRSLILADAIKEEWHNADIHFALSSEAPYVNDCPYTTFVTERSATFHVKELNAYIKSFKPDFVVFDAAGRSAQFRCAKDVGATTVFIAHYDKKIKKGFSWNRLKNIDIFLISQPSFTVSPFSFIQKLKLKILNKNSPIYIGSTFSYPSNEYEDQVLRKYGLSKEAYIFTSAGSGGHFLSDGNSAAEGFYEATKNSDQNLIRVQVWGANYKGIIPEGSDMEVNIPSVTNKEFIALLKNSYTALINGGDTILQALSLNKIFLSVPLAVDQPNRIKIAYRETKAFLFSDPEKNSITRKLIELKDPFLRNSLQSNLDSIKIENGCNLIISILKNHINN